MRSKYSPASDLLALSIRAFNEGDVVEAMALFAMAAVDEGAAGVADGLAAAAGTPPGGVGAVTASVVGPDRYSTVVASLLPKYQPAISAIMAEAGLDDDSLIQSVLESEGPAFDPEDPEYPEDEGIIDDTDGWDEGLTDKDEIPEDANTPETDIIANRLSVLAASGDAASKADLKALAVKGNVTARRHLARFNRVRR